MNDVYLIIEDFYPSLLEIAGVDITHSVKQKIDGISFFELLQNRSISQNDRILVWHYPNYWGYSGPGYGAYSAIRKGDWKFIYFHNDQNIELFNLKEDIGEKNNLALVEIKKSQELSFELASYLRSVDAQMPVLKSTGKKVPWPDEILIKENTQNPVN